MKLSIILLALFLGGCALVRLPESRWEQRRLEQRGGKEYYEHNLAETQTTGMLLIRCIPPSQQGSVKNYEIQIDGKPKIEVFKYSDVRIILDSGDHVVTVNAKGFGSASKKSVFITEGIQTTITYTGSYWMWSAGKLEYCG